jgi:ABC-type uncharacterized transport system substrate-binding protein
MYQTQLKTVAVAWTLCHPAVDGAMAGCDEDLDEIEGRTR